MRTGFAQLFLGVFMFSFSLAFIGNAQLLPIENKKDIANKLAIKSTVSAPLELYNSFNLGVECTLTPNIGFQSGFNIVRSLFTDQLYSLGRHDVRGYRFRNELRLYSFEIVPDKDMYAAFEVSFDKISFGKYRTVQMNDPLTQRDYYQYRLITEHRRGQAYNVKIGYIQRFNQSIFIDIYVGLGVQNFSRITYDVPRFMVRAFDDKRVDQLENSRWFPNASIGWAIGYRIK